MLILNNLLFFYTNNNTLKNRTKTKRESVAKGELFLDLEKKFSLL